MIDDLKQRFLELLEEDAAQAHKVAQEWEKLQKNGARLEDGNGKVIATAAEMVTRYRDREKEFRTLIAQIKAA